MSEKEVLILDRKDEPIYEGDWVLYGVPTGGYTKEGEMRVGQVLGSTRYGIEVEGSNTKFKASHKLTKVNEEFALQFISYTR